MKTIAVTGTPGTGKTTIAKKLAKKLDFYYLDVNDFIIKNKLYEDYDKKRKTKVVDVNKLNKKLIGVIDFFKIYDYIESAPNVKRKKNKHINKITLNKKPNKNSLKNIKKYNGMIIDSHLSHYLPRKYADLCIVTKCGIKELNNRLKRKKFSKEKIRENLQSEIFDICYNEAIERKHKVIVADTTKDFNIDKILKQLSD